MNAPRRALALLRLGRPLHLLGGLALHALGALIALAQGATLSWPALLWGQLAISATQLVTHFSNEYFDLAADRAHTARLRPRWSGGSGILPTGQLPPPWALRAAWLAAAVAVAADLVLALQVRPTPLTGWLLAAALITAWSYSAPPLRLHHRGAGEPVGALLLAGLTPVVGFHLQGGATWPPLIAAIMPLVLFQLAMLIAVSLPDLEGDAAAAKGTWAVLWGPRAAARVGACAIVLAMALSLGLALAGRLPWSLAGAQLLWAPVAARQAVWLARGAGRDPRRWNRVGFWAIGLVVGPTGAMLLALAFRLLVMRG